MASSNTEEMERSLKRPLESEGSGKGSRRSRKKHRNEPAREMSRTIYLAAKNNDVHQAMECFRTARKSELALPKEVMHSILYLLVGGDEWLEKAQSVYTSPDVHSQEKTELEKATDEVLGYIQERGFVKGEVVYVAQARLSACLGDPDTALQCARDALDAKLQPKLRIFTPALVGFAERGDMSNALEARRLMDEAALDFTELEFKLLFKAYANAKEGSYPHVAELLARMGRELTFLEQETIAIARKYFQSQAATAAFTEALSKKRMWMVDDVTVDERGYSMAAGEDLMAVDLEEADWKNFLKACEDLSRRIEQNSSQFQIFMKWLEDHGPFSLVIDGANIAFHKQNFDQGTFNYGQLHALVHFLERKYPERKLLVVLNINRTRPRRAIDDLARQLLEELKHKNQLFATPAGSNDDWYWLYAAIKAKGDGWLVSNDECRDHIFQMLAPKYFLKWKERHLVRFDFINDEPSVELPSVYTCCTQHLSNGTWMLPYRTDEDEEMWLCAKPL